MLTLNTALSAPIPQGRDPPLRPFSLNAVPNHLQILTISDKIDLFMSSTRIVASIHISKTSWSTDSLCDSSFVARVEDDVDIVDAVRLVTIGWSMTPRCEDDLVKKRVEEAVQGGWWRQEGEIEDVVTAF